MNKFNEMTKEEKKEIVGAGLLVGAGAIFGAVAMKYGIDMKDKMILKKYTEAFTRTGINDNGNAVMQILYRNPKNGKELLRGGIAVDKLDDLKQITMDITEWCDEVARDMAKENA